MADITLRNGAKPILHHTWKGGRGERRFRGVVMAKTDGGIHPFVTWDMSSDDGTFWDCFHGHYCMQMAEGFRSYTERRAGRPNE